MSTSDFTPRQLAAIRIAVAEVAGWVRIPPNRSWPNEYYKAPDGACRTREELPDYPADLNAVMKVVRAIARPEARRKYMRELRGSAEYNLDFNMLTATALQCSIAFLKAITPDKWEAIKTNP